MNARKGSGNENKRKGKFGEEKNSGPYVPNVGTEYKRKYKHIQNQTNKLAQ